MLPTLLGLMLSCSHKGSDSAQTKWNVYAGCASTGMIYVLDGDSLTILDSIPGMREVNKIEPSPDGRWLYVQSHSELRQSTLSRIDVMTGTVTKVLPSDSYSDVAVVKNGARLLHGDPLCNDEVIDPVSLTVLNEVTDTLCRRRGPTNGSKVAALTIAAAADRGSTPFTLSDSILRVVDVESGNVYGSYRPHLMSGGPLAFPYDAIVHPDGVRVLAIAPGGGHKAWFVIGDVLTGETVFQHELQSPFGEVAISSDGNWAAVSDPGQFLMSEGHQPTLDIFDLKAMNRLKRFNMFSAQIRFYPDNRRLLSGPRNRTDTGGALRIIDLGTLSVVRDQSPFSGPLGGAIAVGVRP